MCEYNSDCNFHIWPNFLWELGTIFYLNLKNKLATHTIINFGNAQI